MAFVEKHLPCVSCESSDAMSIDDNGWGKCFSCGKNIPPEVLEQNNVSVSNGDYDSRVVQLPTKASGTEPYNKPQGIIYHAISDRKITDKTCKHFGVGFRGDDLILPYVTANKIRKGGEKKFTIEGTFGANTELFGQSLFAGGQDKILVVEGELDALAAYQMLGSRRPVVSVRSGAQSALTDINNNFKYLDTFGEVIFCFDNDDAGQEAQESCAKVFSHKARIMHHPKDIKDACDYLKEDRSKQFTSNYFNADRWTPKGVVAGTALYDSVMTPLNKADCYYPYEGLNKLTYGIRKREMVMVTAGSGLGKSQFLREVIYHVMHETKSNIGLLFMEESTRKTGLSLMSMAANKPLHLPDIEATDEEKQKAYDKTLGTDRFYFYDHYGASDVESIISTIRYMAKVAQCEYIFLDHVSIVVGKEQEKERHALDNLMHELIEVIQETGVAMIAVSHLKRPDGKGHEEGAATSLAQLRGTGSIAHLSDMVIGLERNGQDDDDRERNTTRLRVLKNRFSGITGKACALLYNHVTGRMKEINEDDL